MDKLIFTKMGTNSKGNGKKILGKKWGRTAEQMEASMNENEIFILLKIKPLSKDIGLTI